MFTNQCKAIACNASAPAGHDFCQDCQQDFQASSMVAAWTASAGAPTAQSTPDQPQSLSQRYPKYYKPVGALTEIDVYATHQLFNIQDPSGCIHHASKKLLLSGVRTGGKSAVDDIREARDTLTRYLQLHGKCP